MRIDKLRAKYDIDFRWVHFPLHPDTPMEGKSLEELFAGRGIDIDAMYTRMKGLMDEEGLPYAQRTHTYNSRLAQELGAWADTRDDGEPLHDALYRAYFVNRRNLADIDVLVEVTEAAGLPGDEAREVLESRRFAKHVNDDWMRSRQYGVTGVPTFVAGGYGVVGAQPYEALEQLVEQAGAKQRQAPGNKPLLG